MEKRFFQWLLGERRGEVVIFDTIVEEDGEIYVTFKDNSRVNQNFILNINETDATNKMMAEVENMSKLWTFKEEIIGEDTNRTELDWESQIRYDVPTVTEIMSDGQKVPIKKKKINLIPPARTRQQIVESKFGTIINNPPPPSPPTSFVPISEVKTLSSDDPVWIMMSKAKKVDTEINMNLTISLPSKHLFDVVKEAFDNGNKKGLEYIIENIDLSDIKEALKKGINAMYNPNQEEAGNYWEPECIEEPEVREATPEEIAELGENKI